LFKDPDDFVMSIERYSVSLTSIIGWGRRIDQKNDPVAQLALGVMESVNWVVPGQFIMEAVPALANLPSWIYSTPAKIRAVGAVASHFFYLLAHEAVTSGKNPSFSASLFKAQKEQDLSNVELAGLTTNLIGGGVDTTSSTMISFILAMAYYPEVQSKLEAEINRVVGHNGSPNWDDIDKNLPYLAATVKEVLRWRTVTVLAGIPHANTVDFEYRGYKIPAGTNITGNMWAIHRNSRDFPDPDTFRPERFLNGLERPYPNQRGSNPFGWGRRQCSGQPLAEQGLLYSLCRMVWAFHILPGLDNHVSHQA
jgi:cytochrome P450